MERSLTKEVILGTGAAFAASKAMDRTTTEFLDRQSAGSKRREKQLQKEPSYVIAARKLADLRGQKIKDDEAQELGERLHVGLSISGGVVAGTLAARGMNPFLAGIATGLGIWLLVDEGANPALGLTPPATDFPRETHIRGLVGHLAYGAALGSLLAIGNLIFRRRRKS